MVQVRRLIRRPAGPRGLPGERGDKGRGGADGDPGPAGPGVTPGENPGDAWQFTGPGQFDGQWVTFEGNPDAGDVVDTAMVGEVEVVGLMSGHAADDPPVGDVVTKTMVGEVEVSGEMAYEAVGGGGTQPNSADELGLWSSDLSMNDVKMTEWRNERKLSFFMNNPGQRIKALGGGGGVKLASQPTTDSYQTTYRNTSWRARTAARGLRNTFIIETQNTHPVTGRKTPFIPWHMDAEWAAFIVELQAYCAAWFSEGMVGCIFDTEINGGPNTLYGSNGAASWNVIYPSKPTAQTVAQTRALVKLRGKQVGDAIAAGMPVPGTGPLVMWYVLTIPLAWYETIGELNGWGFPGAFDTNTRQDFIAGLLASNIKELTCFEATFYKSTQAGGGMTGWHTAMTYNANAIAARMSQLLTDSERRAGLAKLGVSAFLWPTSANSVDEKQPAVEPSIWNSVNLPASVRFGGNRKTAIYTQYAGNDEIGNFGGRPNQNPYEAGYALAVPSVVDSTVPTLTVQVPSGSSMSTSAATATLSGFAKDNQAIRRILWRNNATGAQGAAVMTHRNTDPQWNIKNSSMKPRNSSLGVYLWQMDWSFAVALNPGANAITIQAEDHKGLLGAVKTITVTRT